MAQLHPADIDNAIFFQEEAAWFHELARERHEAGELALAAYWQRQRAIMSAWARYSLGIDSHPTI